MRRVVAYASSDTGPVDAEGVASTKGGRAVGYRVGALRSRVHVGEERSDDGAIGGVEVERGVGAQRPVEGQVAVVVDVGGAVAVAEEVGREGKPDRAGRAVVVSLERARLASGVVHERSGRRR